MQPTSRSITNSLKGRIWLAAGTLAVVDCLLGLAAYLVLSFFSADPFLTLFGTFVLVTFATLGFGLWLSRDALKPVEEVALIARSLERSPTASLPRTTGAIETDQLLQTLHRNGQQIRNLISVMDDVAAGKTEAATIPLETSDKLSASFQKLVSKVTDSISAKNDLDDLRSAITQLSNGISKVRGGQLELAIRSDHSQTKEIADVLRFLTSRLAGLTQQVYATTSECERAAAEARAALQSSLESIDQRSFAISGIGNERAKLEPLLLQLAAVVKHSSEIYDQYVSENANSSRVADSSQTLRTGVEETTRLLQKLRNRTSAVTQLARLAKDLSGRANLIALNASIAANGASSPEILAEEIENLSTRSEELHRQILLASESLNSEIAAIEKEVGSFSEFAPDISRSMKASLQISHALCEQIVNIGELEQQISTASQETDLEIDRMRGIIEKLSDVSQATAMVRESESSVQRFSGLLVGLRDSVSDLKISGLPQVRPASSIPELIKDSSAVTSEPDRNPSPEPSFGTLEASADPSRPEAKPAMAPTGFETMIDMTAHFGEN